MHDDYRINPLHVMLSQTSTYVRSYDSQTKWIFFLLKIMTYWKNAILFGIKFDSRSVYNKKSLKTKIKSYGDETTNFHDREIPNVGSNHTYLAVISLNSALNKDGHYYLQVFLKECKYNEI